MAQLLALLTDRKGALHGMSAPTRSQAIAQSLAQRIFEGQLVPGHELDEQELAANYEVSRTPVRDGLLELARSALNVLQHFSKF